MSDVAFGEHLAVSLELELYEDRLIAVQERWHLDARIPALGDPAPLVVYVFDELAERKRLEAAIDSPVGGEPLSFFAFKALCRARFGTLNAATDWRPHYRWNRVSYVVERRGSLPLGQLLLRMVVEFGEGGCQVTWQQADGKLESAGLPVEEGELSPLAALQRALSCSVALDLDAQRPYPSSSKHFDCDA